MKKIFVILLSMLLTIGFVNATVNYHSGNQIQNNNVLNLENSNQVRNNNQQENVIQNRENVTLISNNQGINNRTQLEDRINNRTQLQDRIIARNVSQLRLMIEEHQNQLNLSLQNYSGIKLNITRNENRVRLAVQTMLSMQNLTGGIGPQISQIAREFNNSIRSTSQIEERIQNRSAFVRFFIGGNPTLGTQLQNQVQINNEKIQNLTRLRLECNCSEEVKAILSNQINNLQQEQNRLSQEAQNEINNKGIFGWLWK